MTEIKVASANLKLSNNISQRSNPPVYVRALSFVGLQQPMGRLR